jgi:hypothetical protein
VSAARVVPVIIEMGPKRRTFAQAVGWPGWCRAGKGEEDALVVLTAYVDRYRSVLGDLAADLGTAMPRLEVVDRVEGDATTEFGAPGKAATPDREPLATGEPERLAAFLGAAWRALDAALAAVPENARSAKPEVGRSAMTMWLHVGGAERAYLSPLLTQLKGIGVDGVETFRAPHLSDPATPEQVLQVRGAFRTALTMLPVGVRFDGPFEGNARPAPYWARRAAWHVLDHVWQLEDRSLSS